MTMGRLILTGLKSGVPTVLTVHALMQLSREKGGDKAAMRWLMTQATTANTPIIINVPNADGSSQSVAVPPAGWSEEKMMGWLSVKREVLGGVFGEVDGIRKFREPEGVR